MATKVIDQHIDEGCALYHGDCIEVTKGIPDDSVGMSVYSPPFSSLYTYSDSDRDMGNCSGRDEFSQHYQFLVRELLRVTMPGRLSAVHCMPLPASKARDGFVGTHDFRGQLIREHVDAGWIYHCEVTIWKDPVTAMQRTKALGLLYKQLKKDSTMSRAGYPDYVCVFRKPGKNPEPVEHDPSELPVSTWQKWASPVWMDINPTNTLQYRSAREHRDERHICPLQLDVIERCLHLWSNKGDTVLSPFMGIGSEGYVARQLGRRFVGVELKPSYFRQAVVNVSQAATAQAGLFANAVGA